MKHHTKINKTLYLHTKIYDRHLQANVGQCRNGDEYKGLTLQSLSPSHKVWHERYTQPVHGSICVGALKQREKERN